MKLQNFHEEVVPFSCYNRSQPVATGHSQSHPVTASYNHSQPATTRYNQRLPDTNIFMQEMFHFLCLTISNSLSKNSSQILSEIVSAEFHVSQNFVIFTTEYVRKTPQTQS